MNEVDKLNLLELARLAIESSFSLEDEDFSKYEQYTQPKAVFVSIKKHGQLRGAMGVMEKKPLYKAVVSAARKAAFEDPRFNQLKEHELDMYKLEITVIDEKIELTGNPEDYPDQIEIGKHGLIIEAERKSFLLPKTAVDKGYTPLQFLNALAQSAGMGFNAWKKNKVYKFKAETFSD